MKTNVNVKLINYKIVGSATGAEHLHVHLQIRGWVDVHGHCQEEEETWSLSERLKLSPST